MKPIMPKIVEKIVIKLKIIVAEAGFEPTTSSL